MDTSADPNSISIRKCVMRRGRLAPRGAVETISMKVAMDRLAPSGSRTARMNLLRAKTGHFIGLMSTGKDLTNFIIINPTTNGDIRWLLNKNPEVEKAIKEVYRVEHVDLEMVATDVSPERKEGGT